MAELANAQFKDLPEFFEVDLGESLAARTETLVSFRELGPPDLCHTVKGTGKSGQKDVGSYHYVSGVDASSSASLAAYLNSLTYAIEGEPGWFSKSIAWKVKSGCYCCFNAFSRVDMRVDVKIPGGVHAYAIDLRGERHDATPELWQETYLSALLRAILYTDDPSYKLIGYRKLDPITSPEGELRFLQAAEALFMKGWQLGSDAEVQVACPTANHLVTGLMKYFGDSGRYGQVANLFEKISAREPEVNALLARAYIGMNEEVKAIQIISSALRSNPLHYAILHVQCDFLRSKKKYSWALEVAKQAVNCAPSEFNTWAKLTEVYVELGMYESALLTLNSCPMFTVNERDLHRMPTPWRTHLPVKSYIEESGILDDSAKEDETDVALQRLPAPSLKGTFAYAYSILAKLVSLIGWDELLKARSTVFVMEEEYRMQKAQNDMRAAGLSIDLPNGRIYDDGTVKKQSADDNASTKGLVSPPSSSPVLSKSPLSPGIPTIKVSTESDRDRELAELEREKEEKEGDENEVHQDGAPNGDTNPIVDTLERAAEGLERPSQAAASDDGKEKSEGALADHQETEGFSFVNKRLCERWLDNLFMCLYEDLRIWTIFRAEVAHFKTQHLAYRKNSSEWEILGELGLRLHHKEEAKDAFQRCLDGKFSAKAWLRLLEMYAEEGDLQRALNAAIRLTVYNQRWYMETAFPTAVGNYIFKLGQIHGHGKIGFTLKSMALPDPIQKAMEAYLRYGKDFNVEGSEF